MFKSLGPNCYPKYILNKITKNYRDEKFSTKREENNAGESKISYFKLPYIGILSTTFKIKLHKIAQTYCKDVNVRLVLQSCKLSNMSSTKDKVALKSIVVYKFDCARCSSCYV